MEIKVKFDLHKDHFNLINPDSLRKNGLNCYELDDFSKLDGPSPYFYLISAENKSFFNQIQEAKDSNFIIFVISGFEDEKNVFKILPIEGINHLFGLGNFLLDEVTQTLKKYFHSNFWGLEKNLDEDAQIFSSQINHSKNINSEFNKLVQNLETNHFFNTPIDYLRVVINEIASNAFYHRKDLYSNDRKESVFLLDNEGVEVKIGVDKKRIAVSVSDSLGVLNKEKVIDSLSRCFTEKKPLKRDNGGAGIGLYLVYSHVNQFVLNVEKNKKTEIIAIIDANKRYLNYKKRITSFHYYKLTEGNTHE